MGQLDFPYIPVTTFELCIVRSCGYIDITTSRYTTAFIEPSACAEKELLHSELPLGQEQQSLLQVSGHHEARLGREQKQTRCVASN